MAMKTRGEWTVWALNRRARMAEADFDRSVMQIGNAQANACPTPLEHSHAGGRLYPLIMLCNAHKLPRPCPEYQFHPTRGWRFDYAWVAHKIAVEIDGGAWTSGRHTRGAGFIEDQRKRNAAAKLGWRVLHYTPDRLGEAIADLKEIL